MSFLSLKWWGFLLLHKNPGVENVHVIRDSQLSIHQHNLPGSHLHYPMLRSLQCPPTPDVNAGRSLALDIALHSLEASFHTLPRHVPVNLHAWAWAQTVFSARWTCSSLLMPQSEHEFCLSCNPLSHNWQTLHFQPIFYGYLYNGKLGTSESQGHGVCDLMPVENCLPEIMLRCSRVKRRGGYSLPNFSLISNLLAPPKICRFKRSFKNSRATPVSASQLILLLKGVIYDFPPSPFLPGLPLKSFHKWW